MNFEMRWSACLLHEQMIQSFSCLVPLTVESQIQKETSITSKRTTKQNHVLLSIGIWYLNRDYKQMVSG